MEMEDILIDGSQPALLPALGGSGGNESISVLQSTSQNRILNGSSKQNEVLLYSSPRKESGFSLQNGKSPLEGAECVSNGQALWLMKTPTQENIQQLGSTQQESFSRIPSSCGAQSLFSDKCSIYGQVFCDRAKLGEHVVSHLKQTQDGATAVTGAAHKKAEQCQYTCHLCKKMVKSQKSLTRHIENIHMGGNPFLIHTCNYCGTLVHRDGQRRHVINCYIVRGNNFYHCCACMAVFGSKEGSVTNMKQTHDTDSTSCSRNDITHVNQLVNPVNCRGSSQTSLTCVDCGSNRVHRVIYKVNKGNLLKFVCVLCRRGELQACFVKLTCKDEDKYRIHKNRCRFCRFQKVKEKNVEDLAHKSTQPQALSLQCTDSIDIIELSDGDEACTSASGEKSITECSDDKDGVREDTYRRSSSSPENDSIELLGCYISSAKHETPCKKGDVEIVEEHISELSRLRSLAMNEVEEYIKDVEKECNEVFGVESIDLS